MGDFFSSFWIYLKVKWFDLKEAHQIRRSFPGFSSYERAFKKAYRFRNPFRICKKFLRQRGDELIDAYGETSLPVFAQIARECSLSCMDTVIELGCGRGRGVFFLSHLLGCKAIGIDWIPFFIQTAESISNSSSPKLPVSFRCEAMHSTDFSDASAIYLYGTCLADEQIRSLINRFELFPSHVKIITVSYPLSDYSRCFSTVKQFTASFPWGDAEVYLNFSVKL